MVEAALEQIHLLESLDFNLIKVSLKAFDVPTTIGGIPAYGTEDTLSAASGHHRSQACPEPELSAVPWESGYCSILVLVILSGYLLPPTPGKRLSLPMKS